MASRVMIHSDLCNKMHETYVKKNSDYGSAYTKLREKYPDIILIHLNEKVSRLESLMSRPGSKPNVVGESIDDTLLDIANYAIMEIVERMMKNTSENLTISDQKGCDPVTKTPMTGATSIDSTIIQSAEDKKNGDDVKAKVNTLLNIVKEADKKPKPEAKKKAAPEKKSESRKPADGIFCSDDDNCEGCEYEDECAFEALLDLMDVIGELNKFRIDF